LTNHKAPSEEDVEERDEVDYDNDFIEDETPKRDSDNLIEDYYGDDIKDIQNDDKDADD